MLVCEGGVCEDDTVTSIDGYYVDLTADFRAESEEFANEAVAAASESRAIIEQAKGSLMLAYGLDADQAFAMLNWWSSHRNVKVRELAARLVETLAVRHGHQRRPAQAVRRAAPRHRRPAERRPSSESVLDKRV